MAIKLKDILREGKVLSVFDFDDTIAKSDAWIYVTKQGRTIKKLDPAQFAVYTPKPGEDFNFKDFDRKIRNPRLIKQNADLLRKQLDKARRAARGTRKVTILTARRLGQPVTSFLKTMGIDAYVVPLGGADPQLKADWIESQIKKGYDTVYFMDDSNKNIAAVKNMLKRYPRVKSITKLIKEGLLTEGKGDCYQAGGRLIFNFFGEKNVKLVHGMVSGQGALEGVRFGHCWVEYKDKVLDHSNDRKQELSKDIYYLLGRIDPKECHYYTPEEAAKKMTDIGHWGPWDMTGLTVKDTYGDLGPEEYKELVLGEVNTKDVIPDQRMEIGKQDMRIDPNELDNIESKLSVGENVAPNHDGKAAPYGSGYDEVEENFADGKNPGRKGISKRVGIPKGATLTQLAKLAKAKGEKGRMARWQLNMRRGKKKKK